MERYSTLSVEFVNIPIPAPTVDGVPITITADPVELAIVPHGTAVTTGDFVDADWDVDENDVANAQVLIGPGTTVGQLDAGTYDVYMRVTDSPEVPVKLAGQIEVY